jgi:uncharacterized protein (DUF1800 family)
MTIAEQDVAAVRFGYGRTPGSASVARLADLVAEVDRAPVRPPALADMASAPRIVQFATIMAALDKMNMESLNAFRMQRYDLFQGNYQRDAHARIAHSVSSPFDFVERLVQFWSNHFTVSALGAGQVKGLAGPFEMEVVRPHLGGRFADMLIASTRHPAMLIYLNQPASVGPNSAIGKRRNKGLNENLAREILELHTLGADGGYTQGDVTEFARLLTGANYSRSTGGFQFRRAAAEPDPKTILGKTYGGPRHGEADIVAALTDFARHPATARHIARKLATHFIADDPSPDSIARLAARFAETDGNLPAVYEVLVALPETVSRFGDKRKTPYEFLVSALKAVGPRPDWFQPQDNNGKLRPNPHTLGLLFKLDQGLWQAPSPAGWPDQSDRWITPAGLAGRLEWINRVGDHIATSEPVQFLDDVLGSLAAPRTREIVANAASRRSGLALVLASAEFNSR